MKHLFFAHVCLINYFYRTIDEPGLKSIFIAKLCVVLDFYILINNELTPVQKFKTP